MGFRRPDLEIFVHGSVRPSTPRHLYSRGFRRFPGRDRTIVPSTSDQSPRALADAAACADDIGVGERRAVMGRLSSDVVVQEQPLSDDQLSGRPVLCWCMFCPGRRSSGTPSRRAAWPGATCLAPSAVITGDKRGSGPLRPPSHPPSSGSRCRPPASSRARRDPSSRSPSRDRPEHALR